MENMAFFTTISGVQLKSPTYASVQLHEVCKSMNCAAGADPELDFGWGLNCIFHVKSFLTLLLAIGNIAV